MLLVFVYCLSMFCNIKTNNNNNNNNNSISINFKTDDIRVQVRELRGIRLILDNIKSENSKIQKVAASLLEAISLNGMFDHYNL